MRYAKALFQFAKDTGTEEQFFREMTQLSDNLAYRTDLRKALENPILTLREKYALICAATVGEKRAGRALSRFITLVLKNHREEFLRYICLSFLQLYRKDHHIGTGKLTTAVPVDRETSERIQQAASTITHSRMELQTEVDASLLGGFVFDINDYRLDASIATQLKRVKRQFIDKNRRIV